MTEKRLLYLSQADVEYVGLTMMEIIELLETAFREKGEGRVEMPPKPGIHPGEGDNFIHAMPAYIPAMNSAGVKWVSGFPENYKQGLPYITGLLILNDPATGVPISVMDCIWITAKRTAAATAVAARRLARPESSVVGVLGCGVQGKTNTEALNVLAGVADGPGAPPEALFYFGRTLLELGREDEALRTLDTLVARHPDYPSARYFLGEAFGRAGRLAEAHYHLGLYHWTQRDEKNARFHLERALAEIRDGMRQEEIRDILGQLKDKKGKKTGR